MRIIFHKDFLKSYGKLRLGEQKRFDKCQRIFIDDPLYQILNNHALKGKYAGYRSINIGGDLRAVFKMLDEETAVFMDIDTHPNLYE